MNAVDYYTSLLDWVCSHARELHEYMFLLQSIVTCTALFWLLKRAWEVLWTPLPRLISILGVEVPDPPEVSLACIKSDSLTLYWSSSAQNKGVVRYLLQVNGVEVGESTQGETVIIEGLKPGNFYNVRVIAVGSQNFQAGSRVIRLRTLGRDGLPRHGMVRNEADILNDDQHDVAGGKSLPTVRAHGAPAEITNASAAAVQVVVRESGVSHHSQRRGTGGRKHSPSTATAENWSTSIAQSLDDGRETIQELQRKQDAVQKEVEDVIAQGLKESEEIRNQILALTEDKDKKTEIVKDKEEASEALRKEVKNLEVKNRQAQSRKTALQKSLHNKQVERKKMHDEQARWKNEIAQMEAERESWRRETEEIRISTEARCEKLRESIRNVQNLIADFTREIAEKGLLVKKLEEERESLGIGLDEDQAREWEVSERRNDAQWEAKTRAQLSHAQDCSQRLERLENELHAAQASFAALYARIPNHQNELMNHANSSGVDFDSSGQQGKAKSRRQRTRKSRTNTVSSPIGDSQFSSTGAFGTFNLISSPGYAPAPYMGLAMGNDTTMGTLSGQMGSMSEADVQSLTAVAPLSPTATSLLPSTLFHDDELFSADEEVPEYTSELRHAFSPSHRYKDPQSPGSSPSASLISSPHVSSQKLAKYGVTTRDYSLDNDRNSIGSPSSKFGVIGSPGRTSQSTTGHRNFGSMFTSLRKSDKNPQEGLPLGSLKPGQSHSFPRSTDEPETSSSRSRRISFSSGWGGVFQRSATVGDSSEGNGPAPARQGSTRRQLGFAMFGSRKEDTNPLRPNRDTSSPRPTSIASSDLPRPSTDSAPFGWGPGADATVNKNSPLVTDWSVSAPPTWPSNPSRRPSLQHGSSSALASEILSGSDEYFYEDDLHSSPPPNLGAIGTRPPSSHNSLLPKLNPNAPKFEYPQTTEPVFSRFWKGKGKATDQTPESSDPICDVPQVIASSPSESRKSRDSPSIHTQNSIAGSTDALDRTKSNTTDMAGSASAKGESPFTKLLRKGSASKFGLGGKDSIFGRKKGGSSIAASDHNEWDESLDESGQEYLITGGESAASSPRIGGLEGGDAKSQKGAPRERKGSTWGRFQRSKKGGDSSEVERSERGDRSEVETTGTEGEHEHES
ncbi:hypothetical protein DSL72_004067 [Monilinia vaccinii-corymbosi]|uniref:Fibronectin type-III domain-containing protein n=1 Tax=Monilinia vaccinii-corymbosi TaxID=61207 RepID=A0A8A3NYD1_9HELO|nr:hypothetical protein DSL72_004067 [Monilinia vaccinii-corymbosi]